MKSFSFREWLTKTPEALFGFDNRHLTDSRPYDDSNEVIHPLRYDKLLRELAYLGPVGTKQPRRTFQDHIEWGDQPGAWTAQVSPEGSLRITLRKLCPDLRGDPQWVCKKVIPLAGQEFIQSDYREVNIASTIHSQLVVLENEGIDAPKDYYPELERLVTRIADATRRDRPALFIPEGVRQVTPFNYIIYHSYRGHGVELPTALRCEQFDINISFSPSKGVLRCFGNEIVSRTKRHEWRQRTPRWNEVFMPSQPQPEISENVVNLFRTY